MSRTLRPLLASLLLVSASAFAGEAATIAASDAFVRLPPPGQSVSAAYLTLNNSGEARKLVKADSNVANNVELHNHIHEGGVMRMRQVAAIDIPAKGKAVLQPGGFHIMLIGLKAPLKDGQQVPLTLTFDDGSSKSLNAPVQGPRAAKAMPPADAMQHMQHHHETDGK